MTEEENLLINGHGSIIIDPKDYPSKHVIVIGKCGTFGHEAIRKEILMEEIKKKVE